jgi:hypothetical protein
MQTFSTRSNCRRAAIASGLVAGAFDIVEVEGRFGYQATVGEAKAVEPNGHNGHDVQTSAEPIDEMPACLQREPLTAEQHAALIAKSKRTVGRDREIIMPKTKTAAAQAKAKIAKSGNKSELLVSMLKDKRGATVEEMTKALGWLPHTLRARISRLAKAKKDGGDGLKIERTRTDGVTSYRIAA